MLGILTNEQIDLVLLSRIIGRLGCYSDNKVYVVPVSYVYDDGCIYIRSQEGLKIQKMRSDPSVCFQVDDIENMVNWRSVIVWGKFEEIKGDEQAQRGAKMLTDRFAPLLTSESVRHPQISSNRREVVEKGHRAVVFRIKVTEKTGRYEKPSFNGR